MKIDNGTTRYPQYLKNEPMLEMFSYKLFQFCICALIAFIFSQTMKPTISIIKEHPALLKSMFKLTIPLNACMLITFLNESVS